MPSLHRVTHAKAAVNASTPDHPDEPHAFSGEQLVYVLSAPRSGSTLLQRMLGKHPEIHTHPEPHLISPLAHLGYHATVDKAPFDHINAAEAQRAFVDSLPRGEADYLDALRAYANTLYGRALAPTGKTRFLDKTPANALALPFLSKLYPDARYVVLTRHPLAIFSSFADSFFEGDWQAAHDFNPIVERYVSALGRFLRERPVPLHHVRYEELVAAPELGLEHIFAFLGLENAEQAADYGQGEAAKAGMGDPIGVQRHQRPVTDSVAKWASALVHDERKLALAQHMLAGCSKEDLAAWGFDQDSLWAPLEGAKGEPPKRVVNSYTLKRRLLLALKKDVDTRWHGRLLRRVKYYCDVILRD